ncbi:plasmid mobilization relaxosome protein MobC [Vibrio sp. SS-MA-C1-2]|uniref:plasmid mobilization relaxosome protein MobC n=1 Tax=Vibrio sp. SS-MA-C1-2 TaxID=2908646 RepID=UPI001F1A2599|nr:plasmid mobilization relaxosome protein MobC [Vibrio sp. SS-MA-C1-2]UJF17237.1 plasmid mobilization relaxosome protein MobC [Vibrio sp. SS-MA-C1-2]
MSRENKEHIITFRLSNEDFKPFEKVLLNTDQTRSSLFRKVVITKSELIFIDKGKLEESKKITFLANKSANNINQIAKQLNKYHKSGVVTEQLYQEVLNRLITIESSFVKAIQYVSAS